jgi:hypothetical protein
MPNPMPILKIYCAYKKIYVFYFGRGNIGWLLGSITGCYVLRYFLYQYAVGIGIKNTTTSYPAGVGQMYYYWAFTKKFFNLRLLLVYQVFCSLPAVGIETKILFGQIILLHPILF